MKESNIGEKIKEYRLRAGISQLELELQIDAAPGSISRIECGKVNPTKETIVKIIEVLGLTWKDAGILFGIQTEEIDYKGLLDISKNLFNSKNLDELLQYSVEDITYRLKLLSGFIALIEGNRLYSKTSTQSTATRVSLKLIPQKFNTLFVDLNKDFDNLMVDTVKNKRINVRNNLIDFIVPAVSKPLALLIQKVSGCKSGISVPIIYNDKVLGAIFFGKDYEDDYKKEVDLLRDYADFVGIAIYNTRTSSTPRKALRKDII